MTQQDYDTPQSAQSNTDYKAIAIIANSLSAIFSPLFIPTFVMIVAMCFTPLAHAQQSARLTSMVVVFAITMITPLLVILVMMRMGLISDLAISDRRQRSVPFAVTAACYLGASWYLHSCMAPAWLCLFFVGAAAAAVCALIISLRWKISAHTLGMGGLCGMLIWLAIHRLTGSFGLWLIIIAIILSGAVASARIYLGRHTPAQTYAGWILAIVLALGIMSFA